MTAANLASGVATLGSRFGSVWSPGTYFDGSTDDGISVVRDGAYDIDCAWLQYTSEPRGVD